MGAPKKKEARRTKFGRAVQESGETYEQVAKELGVTRQCVSLLTLGRFTPGLELAVKIERWAEKRSLDVPAESLVRR